jgi:amidase
MTPTHGTRAVPDGLLAAVHAYERALMSDDTAALDRFFAAGPATLRGDADGLLVGHDAISAFRSTRGGAPARALVDLHVQVVDERHALVVAITELARGGRGQLTQLWRRADDATDATDASGGWQVTAAHVGAPAPAVDTRIWRIVGDPLVPPTGSGPLDGRTVAVKDLYAVAGQRIGAGSPAYLAAAPVQAAHAAAVASLLGAGAAVRGLARTDEFAYSLTGTDGHTGIAPNPRAPGRVPGGSSSGSSSAVSSGHADIGLGTDTGGSIRVPAAYQGLYGIRTSHDLVDRTGLLPLAPSFDTVGWVTRSAELAARVGRVLLPRGSHGDDTLVIVPELLALASAEVAAAVDRWLPPGHLREEWDLTALPAWQEAFRVAQAHEAWATHRDWLDGRMDTLGGAVRSRFEVAASITDDEAAAARDVAAAAGERLRTSVGDRVLVLPAAPTTAPTPAAAPDVRTAVLGLTCLAGLGGLPAVTVPLRTADGLPCGVSLVAGRGRDQELLDLAVRLGGPEGRGS